MKKEIIVLKNITTGSAISGGVNYWDQLPSEIRKRAAAATSGDGADNKSCIIYNPAIDNWRRCTESDIELIVNKIQGVMAKVGITPEVVTDNSVDAVVQEPPAPLDLATATTNEIISRANEFKPETLIMQDLHWKFMVRNVLRGKNIMITGESGMGKTVAAFKAAEALNRPVFYINMGSTQDARAALIGTNTFHREQGTQFVESQFVKGITTPNAVIILDEVSRGNLEAWNILMPVLDINLRTLTMDEAPGAPKVKVDPTVSIIATTNIGFQYSATKVLDRALLDRFELLEMPALTKDEEARLISMRVPKCPKNIASSISGIATDIRNTIKHDSNAIIQTAMSTRMSLAVAELVQDGFNLADALEVTIIPLYSDEGGAASERTFIRQLIQKYI